MEQVLSSIKPYSSEEECLRASAATAALLASENENCSTPPSPHASLQHAAGNRDRTNNLPRARGDEWILLVDDDPLLADVCSHMLEHLGYHVITASDGIEALELYRTHAGVVDLVISDVNMPGMNGAELTRELLIIRPDLPILLCSGYCEWMDAGQALVLGAADFCLKPMPIAEMAASVRRLIDKAAC